MSPQFAKVSLVLCGAAMLYELVRTVDGSGSANAFINWLIWGAFCAAVARGSKTWIRRSGWMMLVLCVFGVAVVIVILAGGNPVLMFGGRSFTGDSRLAIGVGVFVYAAAGLLSWRQHHQQDTVLGAGVPSS